MFIRALLAFIALPGLVGFVIPALILWLNTQMSVTNAWGLIVVGIGLVGLIWCIRDFYAAGKGTLAPWSPPRHLVVIGLYRYSRNPMYMAVITLLLGWALTFASAALLGYAAMVAVVFHLRVTLNEEPRLLGAFGDEWQQYANRVPRWFW